MCNPAATGRGSPRWLLPTLLVLLVAVAACGAGAARGGADASTATDAEWRALATPRPQPLPGAPRVTFAEMELLTRTTWTVRPSVPWTLGISELVVAGLLRRRDVHFVERRRFSAGAAAERSGASRRAGAPVVGISPGAELAASVVWAELVPPRTSLEVRLADTETGQLLRARRVEVPETADPVALARATVAGVLAALDDLNRLPEWSDPVPAAAPPTYEDTPIPESAVEEFLRGLDAEERWSWEEARRAYQAAARSVGFFEAGAALARTARLRLGGTLGES